MRAAAGIGRNASCICLRCRICYRTALKLPDGVPSFSRYDYIILVMHVYRGYHTDRRCRSAGDLMVERALVSFLLLVYSYAYMRIRQTQNAGIASYLVKAKNQLQSVLLKTVIKLTLS